MHPPPPELGLVVHQQAWDRIQLVPEVEANRSDRSPIAKPGAYVISNIPEIDLVPIGPDVTGVEEQHAAQLTAKGDPRLRTERQHRLAADRKTGAERTDFVAAPASQARGAAEKIAL